MVNYNLNTTANNFIDLTRQTFGRWTVLYRTTNGANGQTRWYCRCSCGNVGIVAMGNLRNGMSRSCGCLAKEITSRIKKIHGMRHSPEWRIWSHMLERCRNPNCEKYYCYGGRGIKVCSRWLEFVNFYADIGPRPSTKHTLERIDNNGDYCPDNCRWATWDEQRRNKRTNHLLTYNGETQPVVEWAKHAVVKYKTFKQRIADKWPIERALFTPHISTNFSNRKGAHLLTFGGETKTISEWSKTIGIVSVALYARIRSGWSIERALTTPIKARK